LLEQPGHGPGLVAGSLADLRRINRWLGGVALTTAALGQLTASLAPGTPLTVLDVAAGGGDIARAVVAWGRRRGLVPRVVALDLSPAILAVAARGDRTGLRFVRGDGRRLPFASGSVDIAVCSLVLHHLPADDAVAMLAEMRRVARLGLVVNDLVRTWTGLAGAWVISRTLTRNPLTRHDAVVSVRRAYSRAELVDLARRAGLDSVIVAGRLGYRVAMTSGARR
jgi:ubiquinone/menaquinone biosynthesis C-methylase UbiE